MARAQHAAWTAASAASTRGVFLASGPGIGFAGQVGQFFTLSDPAATAGTAPSCVNDSGRIVGEYFGAGVTHGFEFIA